MIAYRNACILSRYLCKPYPSIVSSTYYHHTTAIRHSALCNRSDSRQTQTTHLRQRNIRLSVPLTRSIATTKDDTSKLSSNGSTLSDVQAYDMIHQLNDAERATLTKAIKQYESNKTKSKLQGELASSKWRLRFGRRDTAMALGEVDPTGSYCAMPDDWLQKKLAEATEPPSRKMLMSVCTVHGLPFIGFGFLDNFLMIIMGDWIEGSIGVYFCLSTMAAAALGNTISDVLGLGLAHYVEQFFVYLGLMKEPKMTPTQLKMPVTQRFASLGRMIGITIGCLLGMFPLLFMNKPGVGDEKKSVTDTVTVTTAATAAA